MQRPPRPRPDRFGRRAVPLLLVSALNWAYKWYDPAGPLRPEEVADGYVDILLNGLLPRS